MKFPEIRWAIIQHYEICETPLVDLTSSLRVACSFALNKSQEGGYVFVLGFPAINGSIPYSVEEELLIVRLSSICPTDAQRPYYQEGYLVGTFPTQIQVLDGKKSNFDVARRLIAKYKIPNEGFGDKDFSNIPHGALFPSNDKLELICYDIKNKVYGID